MPLAKISKYFIVATVFLTQFPCWSIAQTQLDETIVKRISRAIYKAEGGEFAIKPFGILSVPCTSISECERICKNTVRNNYSRWILSDRSKTFLEFLANRYAPIQSHPLNKNWLRNVERFFYEVTT